MSDKTMVRIDKETSKKLQHLKLDLNMNSISDVVAFLVKEHEGKKK